MYRTFLKVVPHHERGDEPVVKTLDLFMKFSRSSFVLALLSSTFFFVGCGGDEETNVASKYKPAKESSSTSSGSEKTSGSTVADIVKNGSDTTKTSDAATKNDTNSTQSDNSKTSSEPKSETPSVTSPNTTSPMPVTTNPNSTVPNQTGEKKTEGKTETPATVIPLKQPPPVPSSLLDSRLTNIPDGDINALLNYVAMLRQRLQQEKEIETAIGMLGLQVTASDKIIALAKDPDTRLRGFFMKVEAYQLMTGLQPAIHTKKYVEFLESIVNDEDKRVGIWGQIHLLQASGIRFLSGEENYGIDQVVEQFRSTTAVLPDEFDIQEKVVSIAQSFAQACYRTGKDEAGEKFLEEIVTFLGKAKDERLVGMIGAFKDQLTISKSKLEPTRLEVFAGKTEANAKLVEICQKLLSDASASHFVLSQVEHGAQALERVGDFEKALVLYEGMVSLLSKNTNPNLQKAGEQMMAAAKARAGLLGKPLVVEGVLPNRDTFDWKRYQGKVVILTFWSADYEITFEELRNLREMYTKYHDLGLEVIGYNLDSNAQLREQALGAFRLGFETVIPADPAKSGFDSPMAITCGVSGFPYTLMMDREGKVIQVHLYGKQVEKKIREVLELPPLPETKPADQEGPSTPTNPAAPTSTTPETSAPSATTEPAKTPEKSTSEAPPAEKQDEPKKEEEVKKEEGNLQALSSSSLMNQVITKRSRAQNSHQFASFLSPTFQEQAEAASEPNPYLLPTTATQAELVDFLLSASDRPNSVRERPQFSEAVIDSASRLLAIQDLPTGKRRMAALAKLQEQHKLAAAPDSDEAATKALRETLAGWPANEADKQVAEELEFLRLEDRALQLDGQSIAEIEPILPELETFFSKPKIGERHLRLASTTIRLVNQLDQADSAEKWAEVREKHFQTFGKLFAKSDYKKLAAYGNRIAQTEAASAPKLVGTPFQVVGKSLDGIEIDSTQHKGKPIIIDFWATWCGPCIRELPNVEAFYEKNRDKGLVIIGVSLDRDEEALAKFLESHPMPWQSVFGTDANAAADAAAVRAIPTMILLDGEGRVVKVANRIEELSQEFDRLVSK